MATRREVITSKAIEILKSSPGGVRYSELVRVIHSQLPDMLENTIQGTIWNLDKRKPNEVYKPKKGIFRHVTFREKDGTLLAPVHLTDKTEGDGDRVQTTEPKDVKVDDRCTALIERLKKTQCRSQAPDEFEAVLKDVFVRFGFNAELIGGSGDTDVLLTANIGNETYKVTVDGKTTKKGRVFENQINWDSLEDHREKNGANYTVIVGPGFSGGNLFARAKTHSVSVLTAEYLINLLKEHSKHPFTLLEFKDLFTGTGDLSKKVDGLLEQNKRKREILAKFKTVLKEMMNLQVAYGSFNLDSLRGRLLEYEMDKGTLKAFVELLKMPFVKSVIDLGNDEFILVNTIENLANLFGQISTKLKGIKVERPPVIILEPPAGGKETRQFGSKYFEWKIKGNSVVAGARKENPYDHHCPLTHAARILSMISTCFRERDVVNAELVHAKLRGKELDDGREYRETEKYKIRMMLGILELEGLIGWTGSKRPIEYKLKGPKGQVETWIQRNLKKGKS